MTRIKVDLEVGPAMDIEFLLIEGVKLTNAITPTGSKWKISMHFEDISPTNQLDIQLVATGIPGRECELSLKVDDKDAKLKDSKKEFRTNGYLYFDEEASF